jgi:predicted ATPase
MFKKIYVRNVKVWGEQLWEHGVELAPVTMFLGANSAGKTSLLQLPLLLKQTFESADRHLDLNLGGQPTDILDLGSYEDIVHNHETSLNLGLGLELDGVVQAAGSPTQVSYRTVYTYAKGVPVVQRLEFIENGEVFAAERQSKGGYLLEAPAYEARIVANRLDAKRNFRPERSLMFSTEALAELGESGGRVQDLGLFLRQAVGNIAYLGPLRERPERSYLWNNQSPGDLGSRGERAVQALFASANSRARRRPNEEGGQGWLVEKVSNWLCRMGVADSLTLERQGRSRHFEVIIETEGRRANVTDVGFGISQVLPMLVLAYFVPQGATILAEQPEIHLHPRAQVGLAELMVEVARERNVQFLVESHSEHMFRRLQFLIADERLDASQCRLYFIDRDEARKPHLRKLKLDQYGRVANWPTNFFGDSIGETERQMRRALDRMKAGAKG